VHEQLAQAHEAAGNLAAALHHLRAAQACGRRLQDLPAQRRIRALIKREELSRARRFQHPMALAMVDIDHFKRVNDEFSHGVGDAALRVVAHLLRDACRGSDVVGRYGGEEFLVVLAETTPSQAREVCEKLRQRVAGHDWRGVHPALAGVTVSIGVAGFEAGAVAVDLVDRADRLLYQAKRDGRNCGRG